MLWPLLVEYTEPGIPLSSHIQQQQGNMALFLTLFIVTCIEVLIVRVVQSERELQILLTSHDPPYLSEYLEDDQEEYEMDEMCDAAPMPLKKEENKSDKNGFSISPDTVHVRELIEKLVETIIGGSLDGITVGKLSAHASYLAMFEKYHGLLCGELARLGLTLHLTRARSETLQSDESNSLRFSLSRLLQRIISEAMALPNLREILCHYSSAESGKMLNETPNDFESKCYEDILATAILNKVIENFQKPNKNEKLSENKKRHKCTRVKAGGMTDEESMYNSDWSEASASEPLSLTIEEHIEEVTTAYQVSDVDNDDFSDYEIKCKRKIPFPESGRVVRNAESDDEISESEEHSHVTELVMSTPSWEKNWLFQKKRVQCTPNAHHPVPVPMLVPNPSEDFRALVGGVDADDLSEMSDCDDSVLEDLVTEDCQAVNATSTSTCGMPEQIVLNEKETRHDEQDEDYKSKASTNDEIDNELTEKEIHEKKAVLYESTYKLYKIADITPHHEEGTPEEKVTKTATWFNDLRENASHTKTEGAICQRIEICEHEKALRCPIAEREKEKWKNPVSIPDNPYSSENIEKREQRRRQEYFRTGNYFRDAINFPDYDSSREIFSADNNEKLRVTRDYYVNGIKNFKTGALPVSMATKNVNGKNQVSSNFYECSPWTAKDSNRSLSRNQFTDDCLESFSSHSSLFSLLKSQTIRNRHFSTVFQTSKRLENDIQEKTRYGSHSLKLRPKRKEPLKRFLSLGDQLSDFERKSLRDDLAHMTLKARGASPMFVLNPLFDSNEAMSLSHPYSSSGSPSSKKSDVDSGIESELMCYDPIVPYYQRTFPMDRNARRKVKMKSQESGYGSDSHDYSSDSLENLCLISDRSDKSMSSSAFPSVKRNSLETGNTWFY
ncbi:hypothetical protein RUM44_011764 [Polyplax serrata]|uniref:Uncharacterized protein n=1 Tax=Polyplax serrata TaxID=468196 RepID=A0ABR1AQY9_POLSC